MDSYAGNSTAMNIIYTYREGYNIMDFNKLQKIISDSLEKVNIDDIKPDSKFIDDLGADSYDFFQIVTNVEEDLGIEIPQEDLEAITAEREYTVSQLLDFVNKLQS
jgi:acyl carrier protein